MLLPDGTLLITMDERGMAHAYDPVKAHEYYMRTRKLKGRKPGKGEDPVAKTAKPGDKKANVAKKKAAWENFLKSLPLAQEGMPLPQVDKFVKSLRGKTDDQLKAEIVRLKRIDAKSKNPSPKGGLEAMTVQKILSQRAGKAEKTRKRKLSAKEKATQLNNVKRTIVSIKSNIRKLERELRSAEAEARKTAAKAKKGPTRAEKSEAAREAKKYRAKNQQKLSSKGKSGDTKKGSAKKQDPVATLKRKITEAKGALAIAEARQLELSGS